MPLRKSAFLPAVCLRWVKRRVGEFVEADQSDLGCPTARKNISGFQNNLLAPDPNHFYISEIPSHSEGRCATSTARVGDAVDADAPIDDSARMRTAKTCGPDASWLASSLRQGAQATVTTQGRIAGESTP
jgi:hypothetical protein